MTLLHGHDVSAYQGATVPAVDFVLVKVTEGKSYTSSRFSAQWKSAKTRSKHRGGYHFARPEESSYGQQAGRFLDLLEPVTGESVMLDLEASDLSQAKTNTWARNFGDYLRDHASGVTTIAYLGSAYATNGTGRDLADHFDYWMYPQYPSAYQLTGEDHEARRAVNRSSLTVERRLLSRSTSSWPPSVSPWLPAGLTTGWDRPHLWQFTDNFGGLDASVSALTLDQLAHAGGPVSPLEEDMAYGGQVPAGKGQQVNVSFPRGSMKAVGFVCDNSIELDGVIKAEPQPEVRYAFHRKAGSWQTGTVKVGSADGGKDHSPKKVVSITSSDDVDYASFVRLDDGTRTVGWDMS